MASSISLVIGANKEARAAEFKLPDVTDDGLLLEVELARVTERDKKVLAGQALANVGAGVIPGSIALGRVCAIGDKASTFYGVTTGDRVVVEPFVSCYRCKACLTAQRSKCGRKRRYGENFPVNEAPGLGGAYGQYMYVRPGSRVHQVPDDWDAGIAVLLPEACLAAGALFEAGGAGLGKQLLVDAPTVPGLLAAALARESGLAAVSVAVNAPEEADLALRMGVDQVLVGPEEIAAALADERRPEIFLATAANAELFNAGVKVLKPGGTAVGVDCLNTISPEAFRYAQEWEIALKSVTGPGWDVKGARKLLAENKYPLAELTASVCTLTELLSVCDLSASAFAALRPQLV